MKGRSGGGSPFLRFAVAAFALMVAVCGGAGTPAGAQSSGDAARLGELFAEGNALYEKGDFEGAIDRYSRLVEAGVTEEGLAYNLANSYYKAGDFGRAVLFYERARRLAPRDRDVRENLALVRLQLRDKQFVREQNRVVASLMWLHNNLNTREMLLLASLCYLLLCFLGIVFVFRDSAWVSRAYRWLSLVSPGRLAGLARSQDIFAAVVVAVLLFASTGLSAYDKVTHEKKRQAAVVLDEEVSVFSGPMEDTTLQFKVHEGTVLRIREERRGWTRIELPGRLSGWIPARTVERI
jgi:tetratricopeptide (TPR) repeat protein